MTCTVSKDVLDYISKNNIRLVSDGVQITEKNNKIWNNEDVKATINGDGEFYIDDGVSSIRFEGSKTINFNLTNDNKIATATYLENLGETYNLIVNIKTTPVREVCYTVKSADITDAKNRKIYFAINGVNAKLNDKIYSGDTVTFDIYSGIDKQFFTWGVDHTACNFYAVSTSGTEQFLDGVMSGNKRKLTVVMKTPKEQTPSSPYSVWEGVSMDSQDSTGYYFSESDYQRLVDNNATMTANGVAVTSGMFINFGANLISYAKSGWKFDKTAVTPYSSIYFQLENPSGQIVEKGFTVSDDGKTATFTLVKDSVGTYQNFYVTTSQTTEVTGTNNVYSITPDILTDVNNKRFVIENNVLTDYGQYILSVIQLPFILNPEYILEPENIQLANKNIGVMAPVVNTDKLTVDLGEITVAGINNNLLDYANTTALIYLPYSEPMNIDLEHVIDKTVSIKYVVDCYTGIANVLISSTSINDVIINRNVDLGINIPMANNRTTKAVDNSNISVGGDNGIKTPFISIVRNDAVLSDGFFTIPIVDENLLSTNSGYVRVEDVNLVGNIQLNERETIISKLKSGVIIK